ncbi:MAG: metal-sensitive transcriptional regulator, partial [Actinomycetota bacterium]
MKLDEDVRAELHRRLRRIEGQVRGIQQMLDAERECREIVTQLAAATKALEESKEAEKKSDEGAKAAPFALSDSAPRFELTVDSTTWARQL